MLLFSPSPTNILPSCLLVCIGLLLVGLAKVFLSSRRPKGFPPGPPTVPIIGNLNLLPSSKSFLKFHGLRKEYGDIMGLKFGPQNVVVLNSHYHVKELYDKRGAIYSSRPENYVGNEIICPGGIHILLLPYSAAWRKLRRVFQQLLNITMVDSVLPIQSAEASKTVHDLIQDPEGYYDHLRRFSTGIILASVFGQRGKRFKDENVQELYAVQDEFSEILEPGATPPVDAFPILKYIPTWMPGAGWKRWAKKVGREQGGLYRKMLQQTRERVEQEKGKEVENGVDYFLRTVLRDQEIGKNGLNEGELAYIGGIFMEAGSDTTSSTLLSFCLAMIAYPHVLKKCQEEVDAFCLDRIPTAEDTHNFPYLRACITEVLRWRPVAPGGIPHVVTEDDVYGGYLIPKGTMLFANTWGIHQDENEYENPAHFMPERWLNNKFGNKGDELDAGNDKRRVTYAFGAGRRVCPGQRLALNSLRVITAKLVWTFNILASSPVDTSIETGYTDGFVTAPKRYPAKFAPRSEKHVAIAEKEALEAESFLSRFG